MATDLTNLNAAVKELLLGVTCVDDITTRLNNSRGWFSGTFNTSVNGLCTVWSFTLNDSTNILRFNIHRYSTIGFTVTNITLTTGGVATVCYRQKGLVYRVQGGEMHPLIDDALTGIVKMTLDKMHEFI